MAFEIILISLAEEGNVSTSHRYTSNQQEKQGFQFQMKTMCHSQMPLSHIGEGQTRTGLGVPRESSSLVKKDKILKTHQSYKYLLFLNVMIKSQALVTLSNKS